ncbi:MAG: lipid-A-disaccharide synthase [Planctomycetota bacterium]
MRVFLSAGEPSGDHHAALLVRAIKERHPDVECVGLGGPCMAAEGCVLLADLTQLAIMWFVRVVLSIHRFVELVRRAERSFVDHKPDVCVLIDFPGFHWWLAWRAKRHGIPVVFYCPPQIWAWASWRIGKMRRLIDHVLSALPFEHDWFVANGMHSTLVGHPFFDASIAALRTGPPRGSAPLVLLLPGSRGQEIEMNLSSLLKSAAAIHAKVPQMRCVVGALHERHARVIRSKIDASTGTLRGLCVEVEAGSTRRLIRDADSAIAVSGSVSLELLAARVPAVIVYRVGSFSYIVQSWFRHARFITLVNLLAASNPIGPVRGVWRVPKEVAPADPEAIYPEYLAVGDPSQRVSEHVVEWLTDPRAHQHVVQRLEAVASEVGQGGSAVRAAVAVLAIAAGSRIGMCGPASPFTRHPANAA